MIVVNFFAGPGAGKSTSAFEVTSILKKKGINVELVTEFAKELVWEGNFKVLACQPLIGATQYWKMKRLENQVDIVVTDSPLPLSVLYGREYQLSECTPTWEQHIMELHNSFTNLNYTVQRLEGYNPKGRMQNLETAIKLDENIQKLLKEFNIETTFINKMETNIVIDNVLELLKK